MLYDNTTDAQFNYRHQIALNISELLELRTRNDVIPDFLRHLVISIVPKSQLRGVLREPEATLTIIWMKHRVEHERSGILWCTKERLGQSGYQTEIPGHTQPSGVDDSGIDVHE